MTSNLQAGWKTMPLEDWMAAIIDYRGKTPEKTSSGIPLITAKIVKGGRIEDPEEFIAEDAYEQWMRRGIPESGDVVLTTEAPLGEVAQLDGRKVALAQRIITLRGKPGLLDNTYLKFALQSQPIQEQLQGRASGSTVTGIKQSELRKLRLTFPSLKEQQRVAGILGSLDDKIDVNRRINQTLEAMAQAIFKSWFVDFDPVKAKIAAKAEGGDPLRAGMTAISGKQDAELDTLPPDQFAPLAATAALFPDEMDESELGEIPKGWHPSTLGEQCVYLNRGISPKYIDEGGVLVLNQKCIRDFSLDPSKGRRHDLNQRNVSGRELQIGDVLVNSTGVGTLGRVAQVLRLNEPTIVDSHVTVVRSGSKLNSAYLGQWFVTKQPDIEAMGEGSTGQTELSRGKLASMSILVPNLAVLRAFATAVAPMQSLMSNRNRESLGLQETRDALLPLLLSGELNPSGALEGAEA
jgi:type I restriction enzyme, S subunit